MAGATGTPLITPSMFCTRRQSKARMLLRFGWDGQTVLEPATVVQGAQSTPTGPDALALCTQTHKSPLVLNKIASKENTAQRF